MYKSFAKIQTTLFVGHLWAYSIRLRPSELFFKIWDTLLFLLYNVIRNGKKLEKTDDSKILNCRGMEKRTKPNLYDTPARVSDQVLFAPRTRYGVSGALWWYILVRLWAELFVSQVLIKAETTVSRKISSWSKGNEDRNKTKIKLQ